MEQKLIECCEIPENCNYRVVGNQIEIWNLNGKGFPKVIHELTPNDVYCISENPLPNCLMSELGLNNGTAYCLPNTESNFDMYRTFKIADICKSKIEVSIEEFINICKK